MMKNHSKNLFFHAGIGYDAMDDFFIESSNRLAGSVNSDRHKKAGQLCSTESLLH